jgi:hypothetical protein
VKTQHSFNYNTEADRLPTNNPEYNAALYNWQQYTAKTNKEFLASPEAQQHIVNGTPVSLPGAAQVKKTYSTNTLSIGGNESVGGQRPEDSDAGETLKCQDELGGCKVFIMFNPQKDGINLSMDVVPTKAADEPPLSL